MYNIMTCGGWIGSSFFGGCSLAWLTGALLFFIVAILRKWVGEEAGLSFSFPTSLILCYLPWLIVITFTGSYKIGFVFGIIGALVGGYVGGMVLGGSDGWLKL